MDLMDVLESCMRELDVLCGGDGDGQQQQVDAEDEDENGTDALNLVTEMTGECMNLLTCFEAEENGSNDSINVNDDQDDDHTKALNASISAVSSSDWKKEQLRDTQEGFNRLYRDELAHELSNFAAELQLISLCLEEHDNTVNELESERPAPCSFKEGTYKLDDERIMRNYCDNKKTVSIVLPLPATGDKRNENKIGIPQEKIFSERTKKAVALHIKRQGIHQSRKRHQFKSSSQVRCLSATHWDDSGGKAKKQRASKLKVAIWSRFQNESCQHHITRQKLARQREQQLQEAQRLIESARLRGKPGASYRRATRLCCDRTAMQKATYLSQFYVTCTPAHSALLLANGGSNGTSFKKS